MPRPGCRGGSCPPRRSRTRPSVASFGRITDYVKRYFDDHAEPWLAGAYAAEGRFPLGPERVRIALEALPAEPGALVDLGCGGGHLCVQAARLGWQAVGVDAAPAMIEEASKLSAGLGIRYVTAAFDENGLEAGCADVVAALGLIEYLSEDDRLFAEAARLLRRGGRFVVSGRNRLFNLMSANHYTRRELESGAAAALLRELEEELARTEEAELHELVTATADLVRLEDAEPLEPEPRVPFGAQRRQHTPSELRASGDRAGLKPVSTLALHPHPLPPALEPLAPRLYNHLALAWQRPLERSGLGLVLCSAFVGVFEKP